MRYTFVRGVNIGADIRVGDEHTWDSLVPKGDTKYGESQLRTDTVRLTGTVVQMTSDFVYVEAPEAK